MKDYSLAAPKAPDPNKVPDEVIAGVETLSDKQLMALRHHIDMALKIEINELNLTEELGLQYRQGKELLASVQADPSVPANQKAQVFNSTQAQLEKIVKLRSAVYGTERLKRFESALLKVLELQQHEKAQLLFLELYGEALREKGT